MKDLRYLGMTSLSQRRRLTSVYLQLRRYDPLSYRCSGRIMLTLCCHIELGISLSIGGGVPDGFGLTSILHGRLQVLTHRVGVRAGVFCKSRMSFFSLHRSFRLVCQPIKFRLERKAVRFKREIVPLARH